MVQTLLSPQNQLGTFDRITMPEIQMELGRNQELFRTVIPSQNSVRIEVPIKVNIP